MRQRNRPAFDMTPFMCKAALIFLSLPFLTMCPAIEYEDDGTRLVEGQELSEEEAEELLKGLPPLQAEDQDEQPEWYGRLDAESPALEIDDEQQWTVQEQAPPTGGEPEGPLQVMAVQPEGQMKAPTQVAITFDRPVAELGRVDPEVERWLSIEPKVEGQWRWMGTRTAVFEPRTRWPRSTNFRVEIGEGLKALDGARLNDSVRFEFSTPTPRLVGIYPTSSTSSRRGQPGKNHYSTQERDVPLVVLFDQPVDTESATSIRVRQDDEYVPMQVLTGEARRQAAQRLRVPFGGEEERMIALSPKRDYGPGRVHVEVDGPVMSAEGPEVGMLRGEMSAFSTYFDLELRRLGCAVSNCIPDSRLWIEFNNAIDRKRSEYSLSLEPEAGEVVEVVDRSERGLGFKADLEPDQDYRMRFEGVVYDRYGQRLEVDETVTFSVLAPRTRRQNRIQTPPQHVLVRPVDAPRRFPLEIGGGRRKVEVRVYDVASDEFQVAPQRDWRMREPSREADLTEVFEFDHDQQYEVFEREVDYSSLLGRGEAGHIMVVVDLGRETPTAHYGYRAFWVQHTDLSATLSSDFSNIAMTVSSLRDGSVVSSADLWVDDHLLGTTDERGRVDFSVSAEKMGHSSLRISSGEDSLLIPSNGRIDNRPFRWGETELPPKEVLWHLVGDRGIYRPGEEIILRGWLRSLEYTPDGLPRIIEDAEEVEYQIRLAEQRRRYSGTLEIDRFGGFELRFPIPEDAALGEARIALTFENEELVARTSHTVEVREYRRPRFELSLEPDQKTQLAGDELMWWGTAQYLTGGPVTGGDTRWHHRESWTSFRPPGWSDWRFASSVGWQRTDPEGRLDLLSEEDLEGSFGSTDEGGDDRAVVELRESTSKAPRRITTTFSVTDLDRQSWEVSEEVVIHPAKYYAGLRPRAIMARAGEPFEVDVVVVDTDGERVDGQQVELIVYQQFDEREQALDQCRVTSRLEAVTCEFDGLDARRYMTGRYWVRGEVRDEADRVSRVNIPVRVYGGSMPRGRYWFEERPELDLVAETEEFRLGETARIMVVSPYYPLRAEVELRREGRAERRQVMLSADDPFIEVPIDESIAPNTYLWVSAIPLGEEYRPYRVLEGTLNLEIEDSPHRIDVAIDGNEEVEAGDEATFEVRALDASGQPVADAQVLFFAVDEALLLLSDYELADPIATFYPRRHAPGMDLQTRSWFFAEGAPEASTGHGANRQRRGDRRRSDNHIGGPGATLSAVDTGSDGNPATDPVRLRQNFDGLAFFRSDLVTDERGRVSVTEVMPDTLTRYRLMAVVDDGDHRFGRAEREVTTAKEIMVKPSPPRFLSVGDRFDLSLIVHNHSDEARTVKLALRSTEHLQWPQGRGRSVEVAAGERLEVAFVGRALRAGDADIQVLAKSGAEQDARSIGISVLTPATTETFSTYGSIGDDDDMRSMAVGIPPQIDPDHGELRISFSSSQVHSLSDALRALVDYEFETAHDLASKILGVLAVYDRLEVFDTGDDLHREELEEKVQGWVRRLEARQGHRGGFDDALTRRNTPFTTVHGSYALWRAHQEGFDVDERTLQIAKRGLERIERDTRRRVHSSWQSHVEAYALFVRHEMGEASKRDLDRFLTTYGIIDLRIGTIGWLLPVAEGTQFEDELMRRILDAVDDRGAVASFRAGHARLGADGASEVFYRFLGTDAVVLDALLRTSPEHPLVEKLASHLLDARHQGRWRTPQVNALAMMALRRYFENYEEEEPRFVARAWLGERQVFEEDYEGRDARGRGVEIPTGELSTEKSAQSVVLQRDGQGRMYYRLGLRYVPLTRSLSAMNQGFWVERSYAAIDDDDDVRRTDDGWEIRAGARVRVELTLIPSHRSHHVALVDWIPAGLEVVDPALATNVVEGELTAEVFSLSAQQAFQWRWWDWSWYQHVNLRDERVEIFARSVDPDLYTYSYVTRATTPGEFVAMPARAESTWQPEIFGRSQADVVRVVR